MHCVGEFYYQVTGQAGNSEENWINCISLGLVGCGLVGR